jgi:Family of unknown function (DUF6262)
MRGNPDNLRRAAARKSAAAQARAEHGLREMIRANQPITFRGLAQTAGVSLDFLYRCAPIRQRVEHLRAQQHNTPPPVPATTSQDAPSSVVRTLTAQLSALKQRHRDEVHQLRQALEAAQGEILDLRRRLGHRRDIEPPHPGTDGHPSSSPTAAPHALDATDVQTVNRSLADASANGRPAQTRE